MPIANSDQADHWNNSDDAGQWVRAQAQFDGMLAPFVDVLLDRANVRAADRVIDVGCGCGATTRAAARVAVDGRAHGVDLSREMLARARETALEEGIRNVTFEEADAQVHPFAAQSFDATISRFGIMFFSDSTAAFANLRRASRRGGRLAFVCWQPFTANEWLTVPAGALAQHVPPPVLGAPGAPGMMAFADPDVPRRALVDAGWHDVAVEPWTARLLVGGPGTVDTALGFLRNGSMARGMLGAADPDTRARALDTLRAVLEAHADDDGVRLGAAVWVATATA